MKIRSPAEMARHTAGAHRFAADAFRASPSPAQRAFAPVLDAWAANADRRGDEAERKEQGELFG